MPGHNKTATAEEKNHEKTKKPRQYKKAAAIKKNPRQSKKATEKPQRNEKETHQNKMLQRNLLWNKIPSKCKNLDSLEQFKGQIKQWNPTTSNCKICKEGEFQNCL